MEKNIYHPRALEEINKVLDKGMAICNECGAVMEHVDGGLEPDTYVCPDPDCGTVYLVDDYYYGDEPPELEIPEGCAACGGPYPDCMTSCKMFDD